MHHHILVVKCILFISILGITSCDPNSDDPIAKDVTGHPVLTKEEVLLAYEEIYLPTTVDDPQWTGSAENCDRGTIPQSVQDKVLARINYYRLMVGLPGDVTFDTELNDKCQAAALMFLRNQSLSHDPPTSWSCWSNDGFEAAGNSNIGLGDGNTPVHCTKAIDLYINDNESGNASVGHRRWILYSKAKVMGHGSTSRSDALWVTGNTANSIPEDLPDFISYPPPGYTPHPLCYRKWSFSVPEANFEHSSVVMTNQDGESITISVQHRSIPGEAIIGDNSIVWIPTILNNDDTEVCFQVTISNVELFNEVYNYSYIVTLIPIDE